MFHIQHIFAWLAVQQTFHAAFNMQKICHYWLNATGGVEYDHGGQLGEIGQYVYTENDKVDRSEVVDCEANYRYNHGTELWHKK